MKLDPSNYSYPFLVEACEILGGYARVEYISDKELEFAGCEFTLEAINNLAVFLGTDEVTVTNCYDYVIVRAKNYRVSKHHAWSGLPPL